MKKFFLFIILIFSFNCQEKNEELISLELINLQEVFSDTACEDNLKWVTKESMQLFVDILNKNYKDEYKKIVLCEFYHSGEVVTHNSLAMLYQKNDTVKLISYGEDYNKEPKVKEVPIFTLKSFLKQLKFEGVDTGITTLEYSKEGVDCYYHEKITMETYDNLKNLSHFN